MMEKNILITGASGYVGQFLVLALLKYPQYRIFTLQSLSSKDNFYLNKKINRIYYDQPSFNIESCIRSLEPTLVIHLAGYFVGEHTSQDITPLIRSNISFGTELLEAMKVCGVRKFLNTSTYWLYYFQNNQYHPVNLYAATKKAFEDILRYYVEVEKFRAITLRLFDIYGPNDTRSKFIPTLFNHINTHEKLLISPAEQYVDFVYVEDVINAYVSAISYLLKDDTATHTSVDVGSGKSVQLKQCVALMEHIYNKQLSVQFGARPYRSREVMNAKANIKETTELLNWKPKFSLKEGLLKIKSLNTND